MIRILQSVILVTVIIIGLDFFDRLYDSDAVAKCVSSPSQTSIKKAETNCSLNNAATDYTTSSNAPVCRVHSQKKRKNMPYHTVPQINNDLGRTTKNHVMQRSNSKNEFFNSKSLPLNKTFIDTPDRPPETEI